MTHLLNTCIIPAGADGRWHVATVTLDEARALACRGLVSHVGHQSTADVAAALLGVAVPMDRAPWDGQGVALVVQLTFRGEEGRVYSAEEMAAFVAAGQVVFRRLERVPYDDM